MLKVLLTGGGTGGHIYPALAVGRRLRELRSDVEILYVGTERGLESDIVPDAGFRFQSIEIEGFKRQLNFAGLRHNLHTVHLLYSSYRRSKQIIQSFSPDIVLGTGGYVAGPVCFAASRMGIPTIIHEQNSVLGLTNQLLARTVDKIAISFDTIYEQLPKYRHKIIFTGNPRAQEVVGVEKDQKQMATLDLHPNLPMILVVGGSRGAEALNGVMIRLAHRLASEDFQTLYVTGEAHYEYVTNQIGELPSDSRLHLVSYLSDMIHVLAGADLVVTRSGATTIAELTALGKPSILIPSPYVTANHQMVNAQSLVDHQAALLIEEANLDDSVLYEAMKKLIQSPEKLSQMGKEAKQLGHPDAADQLIQAMEQLVEEDKGVGIK